MAADLLLSDLLRCLVECSRKAAHIAQIFRHENDLFELLVEEKSQKEKNQRFVQDFKTLADVLVQETIRRDVGLQFPSLTSSIKGEEQNSFRNSLGECVSVQLTDSEEDTVRLLGRVLDGRDGVARALAAAVHANSTISAGLCSSPLLVSADSVGVWIDPIDSTAEYIQAKNDAKEDHGIQLYGLKCVCVLIGAYDLKNGAPIIGVVNQPFFHRDEINSRWKDQCFWAMSYGPERVLSDFPNPGTDSKSRIIVLSSSESPQLQDIIAARYQIVQTAGAGYKCLLVAIQKADLYVLSHGNTYFWDTCGPHALLSAQGGGIVKFAEALTMSAEDVPLNQVTYGTKRQGNCGTDSYRNADGIIAYRSPEVLQEFIHLLKEEGYRCKK